MRIDEDCTTAENENKMYTKDTDDKENEQTKTWYTGSVFAMNRWYAHYNPTRVASTIVDEFTVGNVHDGLSKMSPNQQRRIRDEVNKSRAPDKQISYPHINPNSPEFNKKYAKLVVHHLMLQRYIQKINEECDKIDDGVMGEVRKYRKKKLDHHFTTIPKGVKNEIAHSLGLHPKMHHYSANEKQKIIALFKTQYMG